MSGIGSVRSDDMQLRQEAPAKEKAEEVQEAQDVEKTEQVNAKTQKDSYVSSEKSDQKVTGLYALEKDGSGRNVIKFEEPQQNSVQKLKLERGKLKMQIRQNADNEVKVKQIKQKLAAVEKKIRLEPSS